MPSQAPKTTLKVDPKEFEFPETVFIRDIETRVFQSIILQGLSKIKGIGLLDGNFFDSLLGRENSVGSVKGIYVEQDQHNHSVSIKVEVNVGYGLSIPEKAEEIQTILTEEMTKLTGVHVACVHVIFKNLFIVNPSTSTENQPFAPHAGMNNLTEDDKEYTDEF